jgi:RHS repeat-associated protein
VYDALNHQIRANYGGGTSTENLFGVNGQLSSLLYAGGSQIMGKAYWGGTPIESYQVSANKAYFQHFDWNMNKRLTSDYTGTITGKHAELPFGDGFQNMLGSRDNTFDDFGGMWDSGLTMHADAREYSDMEGSWMQPDPFQGSYDLSNPQSLNRYSYVNGMPLTIADPSGLAPEGGGGFGCGFLCQLADFFTFRLGTHPGFRGSLKPRPNAQPWDEYHIHYGPNIAAAFGLPDVSCEFGSCGAGPMSFDPNQIEEHHVFSQAFWDWFEARGLGDLKNFTVPLTAAAHRMKPSGLHTRMGGDWNGAWKNFRAKYPNATVQQILDQGKKMMLDFGISGADSLPEFIFIVNPCLTNRDPVYQMMMCQGGGGGA